MEKTKQEEEQPEILSSKSSVRLSETDKKLNTVSLGK